MVQKSIPKWLPPAKKQKTSGDHAHTIRRAIRIANNSSPGPDGIPYEAWRVTKGVDQILFKVLQLLLDDPQATENFPEFNEALLVCLPKKTQAFDPEGNPIYHPGETRPLAISNTDNRLIATTARLRWEDIANKYVHEHQRGFLPGRSMIQNIIDIDRPAHVYACTEDDPALILFDFTPAFPSIHRDFTQEALEAFGVPTMVNNAMTNVLQK